MPAQKRPYQAETSPDPRQEEEDAAMMPQDLSNNREQEQEYAEEDQKREVEDEEVQEQAEHKIDEPDRSRSPSNGEKEGFVLVKLSSIRKEVQCPICLGIIRKTRTVKECLHRFCRECIDKSMRVGNNECPACRTHCASRRSLRDDPNYDALIAVLYPDIDKCEEEELAFHEEDKVRNKQIQASIAKTFQRQSERGSRKQIAKAKSAATVRISQTGYQGRRNYHTPDLQGSDEHGDAYCNGGKGASSDNEHCLEVEPKKCYPPSSATADDNEDANGDGGKSASSADEHCLEVKSKRCKGWDGCQFSYLFTAATADGVCDENYFETPEGIAIRVVGSVERFAWGRGGTCSHTQYGSSSSSGKVAPQNSHVSQLVDLLNAGQKGDERDIHLMLVSVNEQRLPSLERPYICCKPTLSVRHLCQYVALQTELQADEIEIYLVKESHSILNTPTDMTCQSSMLGSCRDKLQVLKYEETLGGLRTNSDDHGHLLLAYQKRLENAEGI